MGYGVERFAGSWGLRGMLMAAVALPTLLTLLAVLLLNAGSQDRMRQELEERAKLVAGALAEASEYGLVSGNPAALDRSVRELLAHDRAIAAIDIVDASRRPFVSLPGQPVAAGLPSIELPVRSSVPDIDFFDRATPHVSLAEDLQPTFRLGPVAGYVRVTMTTEALERAQRQRLGLQLGVVAAAGLIGLLGVALLARRMRASLLAMLDALQAMRQGSYAVSEGPVVGGELRRLQGAVMDLAETLGAAPAHPAGEATAWPRHAEGPGGIARRLMGRLDAALVGVRLSAMQVARQADATGPAADPQSATQTAARILALADQAQAAGDALVEPLRPRIVDALGLEAALAELLQACARAQPSCAFSLHHEPGFACADGAQATELHRAVQGALSLVVANAQASQASVRLQAVPASREVRVVVSDNGAGETSSGAAARLARLREALTARGARVDLQQASTGGTTLVVTVPPTLPSVSTPPIDPPG